MEGLSMNKIKEKKLGILVNSAIMIVFIIFGFCYPNLFKNTLDDILWHGEDGDIFTFGLYGTLLFEFSGIAATSVIKYLINDKMKKSATVVIIICFLVFGGSYMALSIMSMIEDYGLLGKVAIEQHGLEAVKPISVIFLLLSIGTLIVEVSKLYTDYLKMNNAESDGKIDVKKKTDFGKTDKFGFDLKNIFFGNAEMSENKKQDNIEKEKDDKTEKSVEMPESVSSGRLKSTMRTSVTATSVEETDGFKPAGDL